jgi:hypothetical protein
MWTARKVVSGLMSISLLIACEARANGACDAQMPPHQQQDAATIQQLESAWNTAIAHGDTSFEGCLLTPDFFEISSSGAALTLAGELGMTAKNKGRNRPVPELPRVTVLIHGNIAVAYATWKPADPNRRSNVTSDFFVWENGAWHVFFSQGTPVGSPSDKTPGEGDRSWHTHSLARVDPK